MKRKFLSIFIALVLALSFSLVMAVPAAATNGVAPTIDGFLDEGEWGEPTFWSDYFDIYVLNDAEYLYVAFETEGGTYTPDTRDRNGMINVYTMNPNTWECWAYCWHFRHPDLIELKYTYPPDPTQTLDTDAVFAVSETIFELRIPLSELESINLGDTINFHFLSFAEGWTDWGTCWLFDQEYILAPPPLIEVEIDIKPGSDPNSINPKSKGVIPVAILGSDTFDVEDVDVMTLQFGPAGATPAHDLTNPDVYTEHLQDVNTDGFTDLICHFRTQDTGIEKEHTDATLTGATNTGQPIEGTDSVRTVGK